MNISKKALIAATACVAISMGIGRADAQQSHADLVAAATKEGHVTLYAALIPPVIKGIKAGFTKAYPGITIDSIFKPSSPLLSQLMTEEGAGRHIADAILIEVSRMPPLIEKGYVAVYKSTEEVAYDKKWRSDPEGYWIAFQAMPMGILYNNKSVPSDQAPTSFESLLNARWQDKIAITSPITNDMMLNLFAGLLRDLGKDKGTEYLKQLAKQKPMVLGPSGARIGQGVNTGEFPIGLGYLTQVYSIGGGEGGPMSFVGNDSIYAVPGNASAVMAHAKHPNAARLLVDYVNSREVQQILTKFGYVSRRNDVKLPPAMAKANLKEAPLLNEEEAKVVRERFAKIFDLPPGGSR